MLTMYIGVNKGSCSPNHKYDLKYTYMYPKYKEL